MQYKIKKGKHSNYILNSKLNPHIEETQDLIHQISRLDWNRDKIIVILESHESAIFSHELEQHLKDLIDNGSIANCIVVNPLRKDIEFPVYDHIDSFISALSDQPIYKSFLCILGREDKHIKSLRNALAPNAATKLVVDLDAIGHNLKYYKGKTKPVNKVMAMVKANAYGHGLIEIAQYLKSKVDYFGVAYVGEGIILRDENIHTPIMVMNPSSQDLELCMTYDLEPEIHSIHSLKHLIELTDSRKKKIAVQVEIDTGMNRLGIAPEEVDEFIMLLKGSEFVNINGLYSHLACAEDTAEDEFNRKQLDNFNLIAQNIETQLGISTIKHIRNSAGTLRYPNSPTDMIRLGIGLYGVDSNKQYQSELRNISTLKTVISQIRKVKKGDTIGYNRTFQVEKEMTIATIAVGYADGFKRVFSNGKGQVIINGSYAPVVGRVNMDLTMVDISGIDAKVDDEVILFDASLHVNTLASSAQTIPYEIFTSIGERVEREYLINL